MPDFAFWRVIGLLRLFLRAPFGQAQPGVIAGLTRGVVLSLAHFPPRARQGAQGRVCLRLIYPGSRVRRIPLGDVDDFFNIRQNVGIQQQQNDRRFWLIGMHVAQLGDRPGRVVTLDRPHASAIERTAQFGRDDGADGTPDDAPRVVRVLCWTLVRGHGSKSTSPR